MTAGTSPEPAAREELGPRPDGGPDGTRHEHAPDDVVRLKTGNLPTGVVISSDGRRAYTNNEANVSVSALNLQNDSVIAQDIPAGEPPVPGTIEHAVLVGKLCFFTSLGIPDNGIFDEPEEHANAYKPMIKLTAVG